MQSSLHHELHRALIADILDLREDLIVKTDKLINMLGGTVPVGVIDKRRSESPSPSPLRSKNRERVKKSHLELGLRWEAGDYAENVAANRSSTRSVFSAEFKESSTNLQDCEAGSLIFPSIMTHKSRRQSAINNATTPKHTSWLKRSNTSVISQTNGVTDAGVSLLPTVLKPKPKGVFFSSFFDSTSFSMLPNRQNPFVPKTSIANLANDVVNASGNAVRKPSAKKRSDIAIDIHTITKQRKTSESQHSMGSPHRNTNSDFDTPNKPRSLHTRGSTPIGQQSIPIPLSPGKIISEDFDDSEREKTMKRPSLTMKIEETEKSDSNESSDSETSSINSLALPKYVIAANNQKIIPAESSQSLAHQASIKKLKNPHKPTVIAHYAARKGLLKKSMAQVQTPEENEDPSHNEETKSTAAPTHGHPLQLQQKVSLMYHIYLVWLLIPAFDNKGRKLTMDEFDHTDFDEITFMLNGLHPKSYFSTIWDFIMSLLYFCCLWIIPFLVCYSEDLSKEFSLYLSLSVTAIFTLDSIVTVMTPQPETINDMSSFREYEAMRPTFRQWVFRWLKTQLLLDIVSTFPFELTLHQYDNSIFLFTLRLIRFIRLPQMIKRCAIYRSMRNHMESQMGTGISKVIPIAVGMFFFIHINACTIYYAGRAVNFVGWDQLWLELRTASISQFYTWTFFQAVGNIFPMSFKPQTQIEQAVAILYIVVGAVIYAVFVGYISSAAMSLDTSGRLYQQKMEELVDYVKWKKLSEETKRKLVSYYETKYRGKYFEEDTLLSDMNESLRTEISLHNTRALIEKVPFLKRSEQDGRDEIFFSRIATVLHARYFIPGDLITQQGDSGLDMYFILSGKVNVFVNSVKVVSLYDGSFFGEVALISRVLRTATVQAAMPCVVYRLTYSDFHAVIGEFPDMVKKIAKLATEREKMMHKQREKEGGGPIFIKKANSMSKAGRSQARSVGIRSSAQLNHGIRSSAQLNHGDANE